MLGRLALGCGVVLLLAAAWPAVATARQSLRDTYAWACEAEGGQYWEDITANETWWGCYFNDGSVTCHEGHGCTFYPTTADKTTVRGIVGGGDIPTEGGTAEFVLAVSSLTPPSSTGTAPHLAGHVAWRDPGSGLTLESVDITAYGPQKGVAGGRRVAGWMQANDGQVYPFVMRAVDAGPAGSGKDTVELLVGDAAVNELASSPGTPVPATTGFTYQASGTLVSGDLHTETFQVGAAPATGTPAP